MAMDSLFYIVVVMLIMLKLMIWVCVFYSRARRAQISRCQRGIILIQDGRRRVLVTGDCDTILNAGGVENPNVSSASLPPSYDEVLRTKSAEVKPPSYEQVVQSSNSYQMPNTNAHTADTVGLPPYTFGQPPAVSQTSSNFSTPQPNAPDQQSYIAANQNSGSFSDQTGTYQQSTNPV